MDDSTVHIGIFIYPDAEVLDVTGPFEVFTTAGRLNGSEQKKFEVHLIAETQRLVPLRGGMWTVPSFGIDYHPGLDVLIIPGGIHEPVLQRQEVLSWISKMASEVRVMASVCTGAFILAEAGLLDGKKATTHFMDTKRLSSEYPQIIVKNGKQHRYVEDGSIITSAGVSAGIDMSLHLVGKFSNEELSRKTAENMEYANVL